MIHLCKNEYLQKQIEKFNMQFACHCCIKYNENVLMPQIIKESGIIYLSKRFSLIILLLIIRPFYKKRLDRLIFLYFAVDLNIKNGYADNAQFLIIELLAEFEKIQGFQPCCEIPDIYLSETIGALLEHELSHYKYFLHPEIKEVEINEVKKGILGENVSKGIRGKLLKYALKRLGNNSLRLEELACDSAGARCFAKQINNEKIDKQEIPNAVGQLTRILVNLQQMKNLEEVAMYTIKQHLIDHVFDVYRVGIVNMTLYDFLDEYTLEMIESMRNEIFDYNQTLQNMCKLCWERLDYCYTLGAKNIAELEDEENIKENLNSIRKSFYGLSLNMSDYFQSVVL